MNNPELYTQADHLQQTEVRQFLEEYIPLIRWKENIGGSVLDIGCGPGKVTTQILLPMLPESTRELVATDLSPQMIQYARRYHQHPQVTYDVLDIGTEKLPKAYYERFDQVFSLFCLHWVHNHRQAMRNIFDMLQPGGDILLLYVAKSPIYNVMWHLANLEHWKPYIKEPRKYIAYHQFEDNVEESLYSLLQEVGFKNITCRCRRKDYMFNNMNTFLDFVTALDPFIPQLPEHLREKYRQELWREHEIQATARGFTNSETDAECNPGITGSQFCTALQLFTAEMNNPESYAQSDDLPQREVREFLQEYIPLVRWKPDGGGSVMDVGCGPGKVTTQILLPMLPESTRELVATDLSPQMIEYARRHHQHPRITYDVLDIGTEKLPKAYHERFDQVFSLLCLHWVHNHRQAMQNIFDMVRPGGDILLMYVAKSPVFDVVWKLGNMEHWKPYINEPRKYIAYHQFEDNVEESLYSLLQEVSFNDITCRCRRKEFVFKNMDAFMELMTSVDPFIAQLPEHLKEKYRQELWREHEIQATARGFTNSETDAICFPYTLVHIHARKP